MGCLTEKVRQPILIFLYPSNVSRVSSSGGFLSFALGEDDLIDHEEHHHGDAAVEDCGADVIQPAGNEVSGYGHPDAVDGVDHAGDHAEGQHIPHTLLQDVPLGAEHEASLDEEVDDLADDHGDHIGGEVGDAALLRAVADDVPLKGNAENRQVDAGEPEIPAAQVRKGRGQEGRSRYLNTVITLLTITNRPPSRTHWDALGYFWANVFQKK